MFIREQLNELVENCNKCAFIDKPYVKYRTYFKWLPEDVRVLAVGESPPPKRKEDFFYNVDRFDRLRLAMKLIFDAPSDLELLNFLKGEGIFVSSAVKCRPLSKEKIPSMKLNCAKILQREMELLSPEVVVAMGVTAATTAEAIYDLSLQPAVTQISKHQLGNVILFVSPHPIYIYRFRRDLIPRVRRILLRR